MRKFTCIKDFIIGDGALELRALDECLIKIEESGFILVTLPDENGNTCEPWHIGLRFLDEHFVDNRKTIIEKIKKIKNPQRSEV